MAFELIQIIEDEPEHAHLIDYALRYALYQTNIAYDGATGVREVKRLGPALRADGSHGRWYKNSRLVSGARCHVARA